MNFEQLCKEHTFQYPLAKYDFVAIVKQMLLWQPEQPLSHIHLQHPDWSNPGAVQFGNDQGTPYHSNFYTSMHENILFVELYHQLIQEVIAPQFNESIVFQKYPSFRICLPNNRAVGQKHRDSDYGHPSYEINYWVPLTSAFGTNAFYTESEPNKGDFHSVGPLEPGEIFRFYGNKCFHYNEINDTGQTRVSFDFRVIPLSLFKSSDEVSVKSGLSFSIGSYFDLYEQKN
eukprot:TRINITY_DN7691_c0_g1_i3.p1 TRINITY_DN7691_c0_g1~~TRINITY_DN7691_c0_g1_i3.p1  ORF type:complete len:230 (+),score=25.03 TRINITY_DN7691_c0_g1_i3:62-751(+)